MDEQIDRLLSDILTWEATYASIHLQIKWYLGAGLDKFGGAAAAGGMLP